MSRQRVINILRGPEASRIRFTFPSDSGTITIAQPTFLRVARAIERGKVRVSVTTTFASGVAAEYSAAASRGAKSGTILTPPVIGRLDEGQVLHECTHASFDLAKTAIAALDEEAAGYVVGALYFRMTGLPHPRWNAPLHELAGMVADGLLGQYAAGTSPIPRINLVGWNILRLAIWSHPVYTTGPAGTGGSYTHDG